MAFPSGIVRDYSIVAQDNTVLINTADKTIANVSLTGNVLATGGDTLLDATNQILQNTILTLATETFTGDGTADAATQVILINSATAVNISVPIPTVANQLLHITSLGAGTVTATLQAGATWNGSGTVATFNAANEHIAAVATSGSVYQVFANEASVAFS